MPSGKYLVVDGTMRFRAITAIRESDASAFPTIPAYLTDYDKRPVAPGRERIRRSRQKKPKIENVLVERIRNYPSTKRSAASGVARGQATDKDCFLVLAGLLSVQLTADPCCQAIRTSSPA